MYVCAPVWSVQRETGRELFGSCSIQTRPIGVAVGLYGVRSVSFPVDATCHSSPRIRLFGSSWQLQRVLLVSFPHFSVRSDKTRDREEKLCSDKAVFSLALHDISRRKRYAAPWTHTDLECSSAGNA